MNSSNQDSKLNKIFEKKYVFQNAICFIYKHHEKYFFQYNTSGLHEINNNIEFELSLSQLCPVIAINSCLLQWRRHYGDLLGNFNDTTDEWIDKRIFCENNELEENETCFFNFECFLNIFIVYSTPINSETFFKEHPVWQQLCEAWNEQGICINCKVVWKKCKCEKKRQSRLLLNLKFCEDGFYYDFKQPVKCLFFLLCPINEQVQTLKWMQIVFDFVNRKCSFVEISDFKGNDYCID